MAHTATLQKFDASLQQSVAHFCQRQNSQFLAAETALQQFTDPWNDSSLLNYFIFNGGKSKACKHWLSLKALAVKACEGL